MLVFLLIPHVTAIVLFGTAALWMGHVGTNRSMPDLYLALCGYPFGLGAIAATMVAVLLVISRREPRRRWPWLAAHAVVLAIVVAQGASWLGRHIA